MKQYLETVLAGGNLSFDEATALMNRVMTGEYADIEIAGLLVALRAKGETADEVAGFTKAMREQMVKVPVSVAAIDMCGTGGDAKGTFNISTAATFVVAGAGQPVAKHGNRSITSKSGSADVLAALGIDIGLAPDAVGRAIDEIGLGFMFAPAFHPAMKYVMPARKTLGIRTVFNILGPLCNPAGVKAQLVGVFHPDLTELMGSVLMKLGSTSALLVHGSDGLDEISTTAPTSFTRLVNGKLQSGTIDADQLGIAKTTLGNLQGGTPEESAALIRNILGGQKGPMRDIVLLNAAAGLMVGGKAGDLQGGIALATESIDSGSASEVLTRLADVK